MPLYSAYCNALLFDHWSVHQKLNRISSVQLRHSVHAFCGNALVLIEKVTLHQVF